MHFGSSDIQYSSPQFIIELPEYSAIGAVEKTFDLFFQSHRENTDFKKLVISLVNVAWIDISTLTFLISITYKRNKENKITKYILPKSNNPKKTDVLIFLHTWRFFEVLQEITGVKIQEYLHDPRSFESIICFVPITNKDGSTDEVVEETPRYLNLAKDYFRKFYQDDEGLKSLHFDKNFFPLISKPFKSLSEKSQTLKETLTEWNKDSLIVSVLESNLNSKNSSKDEGQMIREANQMSIQNKLAHDVIKESLTNSIKHPNADLLTISSYFDKSGKHFTIVIWDNGSSIVQSLRSGLKNHGTIRNSTNSINDLNPSYFLTDGTENQRDLDAIDVDSKLFFSDDLPTLDDPDWRFLLASFYPEVTSKPTQISNFPVDLEQQTEDAFGDKTGMGLTVLLDSIIKVFDGTVTVRIDNQLITIKRIENQFLHTIYRKKKHEIYLQPLLKRYINEKIDKTSLKKTNFIYQVKIVNKNIMPYFCGNMLTLRIPLN